MNALVAGTLFAIIAAGLDGTFVMRYRAAARATAITQGARAVDTKLYELMDKAWVDPDLAPGAHARGDISWDVRWVDARLLEITVTFGGRTAGRGYKYNDF